MDGVPPLVRGRSSRPFPSRFPEQAGILAAWVGTILVMIVTAASGGANLGWPPVSISRNMHPKNWMTAPIGINNANLAAVSR